MRKSEIVAGLTSTLLLSKDGNLKKDIVWVDEIYSHIVKSQSIREADGKRGIISFTASYELAEKVMKDFPGQYEGIYYVDLIIYGPTRTSNPNVLFAMPVNKLESWIELAVESGRSWITNLNYSAPKIPLLNAVAFNSSSALGYAHAYDEYALACNNLRMKKVVDSSVMSQSKCWVNYRFSSIPENNRHKLICSLLREPYFNNNSNRSIHLKKALENIMDAKEVVLC